MHDSPSSSAVIAALLTDIVDGEAGTADHGTGLDHLDVPAAERAEVIRAVDRLRAELTRLRRREHELSALFSSARELAESRDLDTLLVRLVSRAHQIMGTDVTYLSEFDPSSDELNVRKTIGAVTPQFQSLRVPPGMGLASGIAASRTAQWTQRYAEYSGDPHDSGIDDAVTAEGIVSILGVPLLADDEVLGVLFAATRHEHVFTAEEIALLSALADHASVVMQTAGILKQLRESEDEARTAFARLTEHVEERDRSNVVHQQLIQAVLSGQGFPAVAETLAASLGRGVAIVDAGDRVIASAGDATRLRADDVTGPGARAALVASRRSGHCCEVESSSGSSIEALAAITVGADHYGAVLLSHGELELGAVDRRTIERAAQVCSLMTLQQNAADDAEGRTRAELVADLLDPAPARRRDLDRRLRHRGVDPSRLNTVLVFGIESERRTLLARHLAGIDADPLLVAEVDGTVVAVMVSENPVTAAQTVHRSMSAATGAPVLVIAPPVAASPDGLPRAFDAALRTAALVDVLGIVDGAVDTRDYELFSVLFAHDPDGVDRFVHAAIGAVLDYDAAHNTDLVTTLRAFVRNEGSPTKTARVLNYHPNTILQRLERIRKLLGDNWRDDERLFRISAAVRLEELRGHRLGDSRG
ncbi:GAF domain-containing protein [Gordonia desulfuricans]|uniref:GAF domain-containing protein n=1 Tax=Gordonia desulfuricans TaxID=89051 RepID=A0A7K3LKN1_9ACTN|nr:MULTISPECIES: helix-turn-helix domain-containing protein [Gordonia]EMP15313.2 CdaR family transcriptional regulator [Gordonia sp. NB41Y]NDK88796.1 GAF domain-containing protein [Gordonia desulfuricans]WLP92461.1 helix-turn-helix domain-containing protein [Gordonia sp. NB41Y]